MRRSRILLFLAVCLASGLYLRAWIQADHVSGATPSAEGLMAPLDDAYIFGQYARQALHGEWLHYTPGAPVSTGVSSWSWLVALSALMALAWPLTWAAWALGALCLGWSVHSLLHLSQRLFPALPDWTLPALFLAHASTVACYFQGMDTGLLLAVLLATAEAALDRDASRRFWALGTLLVFTRPEGQLALPALAVARVWAPGLPRIWRTAALSVAVAALPSAALWTLSGSVVPDSVRPKAAATAALPFDQHVHVSGRYALQVTGQLLMGLVPHGTQIGTVGDQASGNDPWRHFPPFSLLLAIFGIALAWRRGQDRAWWIALACVWMLTLFTLSWTLPVGWHRHRYLAPLWPLMVLGIAALLAALQDHPGPRSRVVRSALLMLWLGWGALQWPWFLEATRTSAANYALANRQAAFALRSAPPGLIAVEDAGLIAYYGGHPTLDLLGVTDHRMALLQAQGPAAVEAALRALPAEQRPAAALLHTQRSGGYGPRWTQSGLLKPAQDLVWMRLSMFDWGTKNN